MTSIPQPGTLVVVGQHETRRGAEPVMHRTICKVVYVVDDVQPTLLLLEPLRRFCYVLGYHELGRYIPAHVHCCAVDECYPLFTL
jgi:hypothetical protein